MNAPAGSAQLSHTPMPITPAEATVPSAGVRRAVSRVKARGPWPLTARSRSIRPVEYIPELQDDSAAESTTKLTIPAPKGMPIRAKAATNGLTPGWNSVQDTTHRMTASAPT